jgi:phosphatidylserine/phosphatidylglycerophosphate/cardiolipin synthase-like enzyme
MSSYFWQAVDYSLQVRTAADACPLHDRGSTMQPVKDAIDMAASQLQRQSAFRACSASQKDGRRESH